MMAFAGPSVHRCLGFGEGDGPDGRWYPCPPDLCEAETLLARAEAAERDAERWRLVACNVKDGTASAEARVAELEAALAFYAEQRNYANGAAGDPPCATHGSWTCGPFHNDSWDTGHPGARARAALQSGGSEGGTDG